MRLSFSSIWNYLFPTEAGISQALKSAIESYDYSAASDLIMSYPHLISREVYDQAFQLYTSTIGLDNSIALYLVKMHPELISAKAASRALERSVQKVLYGYSSEDDYMSYVSLLAKTFPEHISSSTFSEVASFWDKSLAKEFISLTAKMSESTYAEALEIVFQKLGLKFAKEMIELRGNLTTKESYQKIFDTALLNNEKFALYLVNNEMVAKEYAFSAKHTLNKKQASENGVESHDPIKSIMETLVEQSSSKSDKTSKDKIEKQLTKTYEQDSELSSILDAASFGKPQIVVDGNNMNQYNMFHDTVTLHSFRTPELMHELSHWLMNKLFHHNALPYYPPHYFLDGSDSTAEEYETMESKVLDNIAQYYLISTENYDEMQTSFQKGQEIMSAVKDKDINVDCATFLLLIIYLKNSGYQSEENAHQEFIVRYPQMVASGCYADLDEKRKEIFEPLKNYWHQKITPMVDFYNNWNAVPQTECNLPSNQNEELVSIESSVIGEQ